MNILIKTVTSPFSMQCIVKEMEINNNTSNKDEIYAIDNLKSNNISISDVNHGQYVAVLWNDKWVRGVVSMENYFLIWLVDHGIYIRPTEKTVYVNLPSEYKKIPSKVFEASIHGVTPVGLEMDEMFQFTMQPTLTWSLGATEKASQLIACATAVYFMPLALLTTKTNDVVLGDLYLQFEGKKVVNFIDVMLDNDSPMHSFIERNKETYVENLSKFYNGRRLHRACTLKPDLPTKDLPIIHPETTMIEYSAICDKVKPLFLESDESDVESVGGSSVTYSENTKDNPSKTLKLTDAEIEKYSNQYMKISGREYNVLTVLMNKARDLSMCELYKDSKSVGRATTRIKLLAEQ